MLTRTSFKHRLSTLAMAGLLALAGSASATSRQGTVTDLIVHRNAAARVGITGATTGTRPACHNSGYPAHYAFSIADDRGKALFAALQAAQLAGKQVILNGTGSNDCTTLTYGNPQGSINIETLDTLILFTN